MTALVGQTEPAGDGGVATETQDIAGTEPQAFKGLAFRDALFPRDAYRRTWEQLDARLSQRDACKTMVGLLELAGLHGVEAVLAGQLDAMLETGELPDLKALREQYPGMTVAAIDRLVHHSTIFELNVESYRRRKAGDKQNARRRQLHDDKPSNPFSSQLPDDGNVAQ